MKNFNHSELIDLEGFSRICNLNELKEKEGKRFIVNDIEIALFKVDGEIYALNNICPHQHTALIYDGFLENGFVVCPVHGWMFDLKTGIMPTKQRGLDSYPVHVVEDVIYVKANKKDLNW